MIAGNPLSIPNLSPVIHIFRCDIMYPRKSISLQTPADNPYCLLPTDNAAFHSKDDTPKAKERKNNEPSDNTECCFF